MYKIGLDIGYGSTKVVSEKGDRICFPSLALPGEKIIFDKLLPMNNDYIATVNKQTWCIGHMAAREHRYAIRAFDDTQRFANPAFRAILATALAVVWPEEQDILLVTGLPLSLCATSRKEFQNYLSGFTATVEIGGKIRSLVIKQAEVFPQTAGVFLSPECEQFKKGINPGDLITVVDIGYRYTDVVIFEYTKNEEFELATEDSSTLDIGMFRIYSELASHLAQERGAIDVTLGRAEQVFLTNSFRCNGQEKDYGDINRTLAKKTVEVLVDIYQQQIANKDTDNHLIMAGGGSAALKNELGQVFPEAAFIEDAQFANAIGFLDVARKLDIELFV